MSKNTELIHFQSTDQFISVHFTIKKKKLNKQNAGLNEGTDNKSLWRIATLNAYNALHHFGKTFSNSCINFY